MLCASGESSVNVQRCDEASLQDGLLIFAYCTESSSFLTCMTCFSLYFALDLQQNICSEAIWTMQESSLPPAKAARHGGFV